MPVALRKGEILALTWDDVDFQKGTVSISKTLKRVRRDAVDALNGKDILYQFPSVFEKGGRSRCWNAPRPNQHPNGISAGLCAGCIAGVEGNTETSQAKPAGSDSAVFQWQTTFGGNFAPFAGKAIAATRTSGSVLS